MELKDIKLSEIFPDPEQPRKNFDDEAHNRLVQSLNDNGVEHPIIVKRNGKGYMIVDGERRWRAAEAAGLKSLPAIIDNGEATLEKQLRSDCLKEGLAVDELDRAIYRYYSFCTTSSTKHGNTKGEMALRDISRKIGKSLERIRKAIDRFEFKRDNREFTTKIEKKYNPKKEKYGKVDSTIAMTDKPELKNKPEHRKAIVEAILDTREKKKFGIDNDVIRKKIDHIAKKAEKGEIEPEDIAPMFENMRQLQSPTKYLKNDPRNLFQKQYFEFCKYTESFYDFEFDTVKEQINGGDAIKKFIDEARGFLDYLKSLESK